MIPWPYRRSIRCQVRDGDTLDRLPIADRGYRYLHGERDACLPDVRRTGQILAVYRREQTSADLHRSRLRRRCDVPGLRRGLGLRKR